MTAPTAVIDVPIGPLALVRPDCQGQDDPKPVTTWAQKEVELWFVGTVRGASPRSGCHRE
jgi:hypothetical protein